MDPGGQRRVFNAADLQEAAFRPPVGRRRAPAGWPPGTFRGWSCGRPFSRSTSGRFSMSDRSPTVRLLMISSVAPSESTSTLPG